MRNSKVAATTQGSGKHRQTNLQRLSMLNASSASQKSLSNEFETPVSFSNANAKGNLGAIARKMEHIREMSFKARK